MMLAEEIQTTFEIDKSSWTKVKLGDVVREVRETVKDPVAEGIERIVGLEHLEPESLHIKSWGTLTDGTTFTKVFRKGQVLFGRRRAYLKKAAIATFDGICSGDITVLEVKKGLLPELLPFLIQNDKFFELAVKNSAGSLSPRAKFNDFADYEFLIPHRDQQEQIAELLWAGDELALSESKVLQSILHQLTAFTNSRINRGFESSIVPLPDNWKIVKLSAISKVQAGSTPLRAEKSYFDSGTIPWVKTLDLNNGEIYQTEEKITEIALAKTSCKVRPTDTVLVAMYGGFNQIGRTGILKLPAATNQAVSAIMVDKGVILPDYLLHLLNSRVDYWKKVAISSRKDPNITKVDVENFPVTIPPLEEQREIVEIINSLLHTKKQIENRIDKTKQLQKSLINQIF
ncbi:restriction endonuclease subunit S [Pontibacter silvestris]|uniref:Restriction endonuclease subunit S n=1 Tax=Pontibacter silvestris TaxID=2305183 RepID=A0ABW4X0G0_9BACT|nr:restriction endonuclease subunit S [Pontibacter silvestris]MCC9138710.1 restriction endonuclease subunit S [Pontibacter silvestris]